MDQRERHYLELLTKRFNESDYIDFIKDLLNLSQFDISNTLEERTDIPKQYKENIDYYKYIAKYNDGLNDIGILIVKLNDKTSTNARTAQRNFIATILSKYDLDASLVAFYSNIENNWRLSFVKKELNFTEKGFKVELTPAKRYSYLVGENESVHTAQEFLLKLLKINDRKIKLEDIEQVFDVEKVTKKFFEEYKEKYLQLKEYLDQNEDFKTESKKADFTSVEFAKKLMGQIVFLYFLQKKGWLGVQLVPNELNLIEFGELLNNSDSVSKNLLNEFFEKQEDFYVINKTKLKTIDSKEDIINLSNLFSKTSYDKPWGTGKKDFIRSIYRQAIKEHKNFFDDYLEPFFYRGLNEKRENQYFPLFNCKIPFLNGGLFEPINNYRWSSAHFNIPNKLFSNDNKDGILDFLDLYNFTIDEEEPLEKEVAVDPEMLGKIFENLLDVDDRKSKGAFYTPREIVYYMCQESLANYLVNKVGVDYNEIKQFIKYGDLISQIDWETSMKNDTNFEIGHTIYDNILKIDHALLNVKIADPAVGSGAFPLGMLTEIIKIRNNLTIYMMIQNELGIINIDKLYNTEHGKRDIFDMKLQTIENCLYAVDIEPSAIDIAKLRLWLSLIVDYPNDEEPKPLPNLDCKIMQGNSLLDEYEGVPLFSEKVLSNNLKKYKRNDSKLEMVKDIHIQQSLQLDDNSVDLNIYIEKMLELQKEYFITSDNKLKKDLKQKIDSIQLAMVEESLKNEPKKLMNFIEESKKHQKPWFIWKLEFYDVFKNNDGFDIVIGNPPYIDSESMTNDNPKLRQIYAKKYTYAKGNWDIYILFFELAMQLLNKKGNMIFITPDKWVSKPFGDKLRTELYYKIKSILIAGRKVFESAKVDSIITNITVERNHYIEIKNLENKDGKILNKNILTEPYRLDILFSKNLDLLLKMNSKSEKLSDKFNVKTEGACATSDAYLLKEIIKNDDFSNLEKFKVVNTGTILPFHNNYGKKEMTYIKDKYLNPIVTKEEFFEKFKNKYSTMVNCKKIILKGLNLLDGFIDFKGDFLPGKTTLVIKSEDINKLKIILAFLQSKAVAFYINEAYSSSSYNGGITFTKEMIDSIPIPQFDKSTEIKIINCVDNIIQYKNIEDNILTLNELIFNIYKLSELEITIINKYFER